MLARGRIITHDVARPAIRVIVGHLHGRDRASHGHEETLRVAREQAEQAARSKSDFLATMSHELRTPLNAFSGCPTFRRASLTDEQREYLENIESSGKVLLGMIDDILDLAKIEAGRVGIEDMACDVCGARARRSVPIVSEQKNMDVDALVAPGAPALVCTDPGKIRQVLFNLWVTPSSSPEGGRPRAVGADARTRRTVRCASR